MPSAQWYEVPAKTQAAQCKAPSCKAVIYWIETAKGRKMPIDCDVPGGAEPMLETVGLGVAHWGTCADPDYFRKK